MTDQELLQAIGQAVSATMEPVRLRMSMIVPPFFDVGVHSFFLKEKRIKKELLRKTPFCLEPVQRGGEMDF